MAKRNNTHKGQTASCPEGWHPDGHTLPINLTIKQQHYGRRATVISRFVYNLCVATRRFCRKNRLKWPSWQDLTQAINAAKKDDFPFVAEVHYQVAEGAVKHFGKAVANWRGPDHRATAPVLHKKRLIGSGSFLAASGIKNIRHDGKRRITPPYLGSVKLNHTLPKGIVHEARIAFRNRQWVLSVNYWKPPQPAPESEPASWRVQSTPASIPTPPTARARPGKPEGVLPDRAQAAPLATGPETARHRVPRLVGGTTRIDRLNRRMIGMRRNAQRQMTAQLVHKFQRLVIEDLNVAGMMGGKTPKAQADAGIGELNRQLIHKGQWHHCEVTLTHRFYPSSKRCSNCQTMNAKLKRERFWQCPACGTPHDRNENAVVNLRDLLTLPADSEVKLRDGPALTIWCPDGETSPADRRTVGTAYCLCGASNSPRNTHPDTKASP